MQLINLDSTPNQTFQVTLSVDEANLTLRFYLHYNEVAGYWVMTITDPKTGSILIDSVPLVTGEDPVSNILAQYAYLKIGSAYLINVGGVSNDPSEDDLGINFALFWGDTP